MNFKSKIFTVEEVKQFTIPLSELALFSIHDNQEFTMDMFMRTKVGHVEDISIIAKEFNNETFVDIVFTGTRVYPHIRDLGLNEWGFLIKYLETAASFTTGLEMADHELEKIHEVFSDEQRPDKSYIFRLLFFVMQESQKIKPSYLQHFWYDEFLHTEKFTFLESEKATILRLRSSLFLECFFAFTLDALPTSVTWTKEKGSFPLPYKHHFIQFGETLRLEHSWEDGIRWIVGRKLDGGENIIIESSKNCGVLSSTVFLRSIARSVHKKENPYLLWRNNCEHLGTFCFYGSPRSRQVRFVWMLVIALIFCSLLTLFLLPVMLFVELYIFNKYLKKCGVKYKLKDLSTSYFNTFLHFPR